MTLHRIGPLLLCVCAATSACASDLIVNIRTHTREIVYGDPVYVEVTIENRGTEPVSALRPFRDLGTFRFELWDTKRNLVRRDNEGGGGFVGDIGTVTYEPNQLVRHYWYMFVDDVRYPKTAFWGPDRGDLVLFGVYRIKGTKFIDPKVELRSVGAEIVVRERDPEELRFLQRWAFAEHRGYEKGPKVASLGLPLHAMTREQTQQVASGVRGEEIRDLLELTIRLQNIYHGPDNAVDAASRELVEWLELMPDIKRQALAKQSHSIASGHQKLFPTAKLLEPIFKER